MKVGGWNLARDTPVCRNGYQTSSRAGEGNDGREWCSPGHILDVCRQVKENTGIDTVLSMCIYGMTGQLLFFCYFTILSQLSFYAKLILCYRFGCYEYLNAPFSRLFFWRCWVKYTTLVKLPLTFHQNTHGKNPRCPILKKILPVKRKQETFPRAVHSSALNMAINTHRYPTEELH